MIVLDYRDRRPLYEQVAERLQEMMFNGVLPQDAQLPSVRSLATDLSINPNTIQRAYGELERQGYIYSVKGKGSFVAAKDTEVIREGNLRIAEEYLAKAADLAKKSGISLKELVEVLELIYNGE